MGLIVACKAFWKALCDKKAAQAFLQKQDEKEKKPQLEHKAKAAQSHLQLLSYLQGSSRLLDFFLEEIEEYDDAQIGAAVRQVHRDCKKTLEELITIRPVVEEEEGSQITLPKDYDTGRYRLVGKVTGSGPYTGRIVHRGWRACKTSLPKQADVSSEVITQVEVEVE